MKLIEKYISLNGSHTLPLRKPNAKKSKNNTQDNKKIIQIRSPFQHRKIFIRRIDSHILHEQWEKCLQKPYRSTPQPLKFKLIEQCNYIPRKILMWISNEKRTKITPTLYKLKRNQLSLKGSTHPQELMEIINCYLLYREDLSFSYTVQNIAYTFYYYVPDLPVTIFSLLNLVCVSEVYLPILTNNNRQKATLIRKICENIEHNCCAGFIRKQCIALEYFIEFWIRSFWLAIDDNGNVLREKILIYLLFNKFNSHSVQKVCQSTVIGLSSVLNKGNKERSEYALLNPKPFIDEELFTKYLFIS